MTNDAREKLAQAAEAFAMELRSAVEPEPVEQPPDVSHLRYDGKGVEIAEPKKRIGNTGELVVDVDGLGCHRRPGQTITPRWILRIKEPLTVYGVDNPRDVDLSALRGPRGFPVEFVDFREPINPENYVLEGGYELLYDPEYPATMQWHSPGGPDKRRIIVREVEPRKPRGWLAVLEENAGGMSNASVKWITGDSDEMLLRPLPDLDDPKVLDRCLRAHGYALSGTARTATFRIAMKAAIEAYLAMGK